MDLIIARVETLRLTGLEELLAESAATGWKHLERLVAEWGSGENRFSGPGEGLFLATLADRVVGVGGIHLDPYAGDPHIGRLRRFYVLAAVRRRGVGSALLSATLTHGRGIFREVHLRTHDENADAFYRTHAFVRVDGTATHTHRRML